MKKILLIITAMQLTACAGMNKMIEKHNAEMLAKKETYEASLPTCSTPTQCDDIMAYAQSWLADNASTVITIATPSLVQTAITKWNYGYIVKKIPRGNGVYAIEMTTTDGWGGLSNLFYQGIGKFIDHVNKLN